MNGSFPLGGDLSLSMLFSVLTMCVGLTFSLSAIAKVITFRNLVHDMRVHYRFKVSHASLVAFVLIVVEAAIAAFHIGGVALDLALPATVLLLTAFLFSLLGILRQGEVKPCLCFGADRADQVSVLSLVRVMLLLVVEVALWWNHNAYLSIVTRDDMTNAEVISLGSASAALTATIAWLLSIPKFYWLRRVLVDV